MQDLAPSVFDDQEAVQELERQRGYSEEIERHEHLSMIAEKREPVLGAIARWLDIPVLRQEMRAYVLQLSTTAAQDVGSCALPAVK